MIHVGAWSLAFSCPRSILCWTAVGRNLAVTRTLGQTACREKHPQYSRALAIPGSPSSQNPRDWGSADGEKHEEAFCRRQAGFRAG
jgi:hypothetical protein